ncbi:hypothetical protein [Aquitalea pelogenes]|uniref:hypothetical protein n=1 Tax=Aquitalea pelogenes TaxID=1293573 RepID=UPI0035B32A20
MDAKHDEKEVLTPKLIIDKDMLEKIASSFNGLPITMGPDGEMLSPGIVDLLDVDNTTSHWTPYDERTRMLVLAIEACRDITFYAEQLIDTKVQRRAMRAVTVPVCKLMDGTALLLTKMNDVASRETRNQWPITDQKIYNETAKRLRKKHLQGPIRWVRNKIGAHLDTEAFTVGIEYLHLDAIIAAFGDCLLLLTLSMNYPSSWFSWIRQIGASPEGHQRIIETMFEYPICIRWITDIHGHPLGLSSAILAQDPRCELQDQILEAINSYNKLVKAIETELPLITTNQKDIGAELFQTDAKGNKSLKSIKIFRPSDN